MDEIVQWMHNRQFYDNKWMNGNCYYFAVLLQTAWPGGKIVHDPIIGHFMYLYKNCLYDYRGYVGLAKEYKRPLDDWEKYKEVDELHWAHIMRDCVGGAYGILDEEKEN